jgi:hypothetical protein
MKTLISVLLILHGLITSFQSAGSFNPGGGVANPKWLSWWPAALGQSWLFPRLGVEKSLLSTFSGILWLVSGIMLIAAGMGLFGFIIPVAWWRVLAGVGAAVSLFLYIFYAHPFFLVGMGANLAILLILLWLKWPSVAMLGS